MTARPELRGSALARLNLGKGRYGWLWHVLPWGIAFGTFFFAGAYMSLGTAALEMILFTLSIDLALGYAGIITFGQAAFFGLGAYATGLFSIHVAPDPLIGLLFGTAVAALFGLVTGMLILHTEGVTLMMLTLAIASMLAAFGSQAAWFTGGDNGLQGMQVAPLFGVFPFDLWGHTGYLYALGVLFLWFIAAWRIVRSPFGRSLDGIRQSPRRMRAIGTPVWWRLVAVYSLSAAMAGTAGALKAQTNQFVGLDSLSLLVSGTALVMLILGGTRRLYGAFVGAAFYVVVQNMAAQVDPFR
ncbi:MAG: branched-chain amino acid ABC transporter permease, partial [Stellaceae bacterium]